MYMRTRHKRIDQGSYDEFLELFISAVKRRWLKVLKDRIYCFNDDIQGTAAVTERHSTSGLPKQR